MKIEDIKNIPYSDWFGKGDTKKDILKIIELYGEPEDILLGNENKYMALILYPNKVFVVGYDGSEYKHEFQFER
ncbi:MAG: hypothetical protein Q7R95_07320 [bacterium]|nr:hypothetical protein [bacterium]